MSTLSKNLVTICVALGLCAAALVVVIVRTIGSDDGSSVVSTSAADSKSGAPDEKAESAKATTKDAPVDRTEERAAARVVATRRVKGRVLDARRMPAPGATVERVTASGASQPDPARSPVPKVTATSGSRGEFTLDLPCVAPEATGSSASHDSRLIVRARGVDGAVALKSLYVEVGDGGVDRPGPEIDVGTLVLEPSASIAVTVKEGGQPVPHARVAVANATHARVGEAETDENGVARIVDLKRGLVYPSATYRESEAHGRAFLPDDASIVLDLAPMLGRSVLVRDAKTKQPIEGADVQVIEMKWAAAASSYDPDDPQMGFMQETIFVQADKAVHATTDASGVAVVGRLPRSGSFEASASAKGYKEAEGYGGTRLVEPPGVTTIDLSPRNGRDVHFPIVAGECPIPAIGTKLDVKWATGSRSYADKTPDPSATNEIVMGDAEIVVPDVESNASFTATTADGAIARLWIGANETRAKPIAFVRARSITVHVVDASSKPAPGYVVSARNQGNNEFPGSAETDASGLAVLKGFVPELVNLYLAEKGGPRYSGESIGSVDLNKGDATLEARVPIDVQVRLTLHVDGAPMLPSKYTVRSRSRALRIVDEFPQSGQALIAGKLAANEFGKEMQIFVNASEWMTGSATCTPIAGQVVEATVELAHKGGLDVVLARSGRKDKPRVEIGLEKQDPATGEFASLPQFASGQGLRIPNGPKDGYRFMNLEPGTYRAADHTSRAVSLPVVVARSEVAQVELALAPPTFARGRVVLPSGTDRYIVRVLVEAQGLAKVEAWSPDVGRYPDGEYVGEDGTFSVALPGDRDVVVRVWHPWLQPADPGGRVELKAGQSADGIVLTLEAGQEVRLPAPNLPPEFSNPLRDFVARVGVYAKDGALDREPDRWIPAPYVEGELRFGGIAAGRCTLLVDLGSKFAPLALRDTPIEIGRTQLPAAMFVTGARIRTRILTAKGTDPPRIYASAEHRGAPVYRRGVNSRGEAEVVLEGLGAGKFHFSVGTESGWQRTMERDVELGEAGEVILDFDLR